MLQEESLCLKIQTVWCDVLQNPPCVDIARYLGISTLSTAAPSASRWARGWGWVRRPTRSCCRAAAGRARGRGSAARPAPAQPRPPAAGCWTSTAAGQTGLASPARRKYLVLRKEKYLEVSKIFRSQTKNVEVSRFKNVSVNICYRWQKYLGSSKNI